MSKAIGAGLALAVMVLAPAAAQAQVKAGVLSCDVSGGFGWGLWSSKTVSCIFTPDLPGPTEGYVGVINKFGVAIGIKARQSMVWGGFAPSARPVRGGAGRQLCRRDWRGDVRGGSRRQCAGRRLEPLGRAAAGFGHGSDRHQHRGRGRRPAAAAGGWSTPLNSAISRRIARPPAIGGRLL